MQVCEIVRLNRSRREPRFQAAVISAHAQSTVNVDRHVSEMPGYPGRAVQNHSVDHGGSANSGSQRQQHNIAPGARRSPQYLGHQRRTRIVIRAHRQTTADKVLKNASLQEVQIARQAIDP